MSGGIGVNRGIGGGGGVGKGCCCWSAFFFGELSCREDTVLGGLDDSGARGGNSGWGRPRV